MPAAPRYTEPPASSGQLQVRAGTTSVAEKGATPSCVPVTVSSPSGIGEARVVNAWLLALPGARAVPDCPAPTTTVPQ